MLLTVLRDVYILGFQRGPSPCCPRACFSCFLSIFLFCCSVSFPLFCCMGVFLVVFYIFSFCCTFSCFFFSFLILFTCFLFVFYISCTFLFRFLFFLFIYLWGLGGRLRKESIFFLVSDGAPVLSPSDGDSPPWSSTMLERMTLFSCRLLSLPTIGPWDGTAHRDKRADRACRKVDVGRAVVVSSPRGPVRCPFEGTLYLSFLLFCTYW